MKLTENKLVINLFWLFMLVLLFWGEPDLHDAIIHFLMQAK